MKTFFYSLIVCMLVVCLICCDEKEPVIRESAAATDVSFSGCRIDLQKDIYPDTVSMRLTAQEGNKLLIRLANTEFCCATDSVTINSSLNGNDINIEIIDEGPFSWCFCEHNLEFIIGPLNNEHYSLKLLESENSYSRDSFYLAFDYSGQLDTTCIAGTQEESLSSNPFNWDHTLLGGCNGMMKSDEPGIEPGTDTIIFYELIDTLRIFVGVNEPCCITYDPESSVVGDTLVMRINTLSDDQCDCICYYTFDFYYADYTGQGFYYQFFVDDYKHFEGNHNLP